MDGARGRRTRRVRLRAVVAAACLLSCASMCFAAALRIPDGATVRVGDARVQLGSGDLEVDGTLSLGAGSLDGIADVRVPAGGQLLLGGGVLRLAGDWDNQGSVDAAASRVEFLDGSGDSSILGSTLFGDLQVATANGRRIRLESGATQRVLGALILRGSGAPLRIDSTAPPASAFLDLLAAGTQDIANVAVWDVHASGQWLAPGQENQGGNSNAARWFGGGGAPPPPPPPMRAPEIIPVDSPWALFALAAGVLLLIRRHARLTLLSRGN